MIFDNGYKYLIRTIILSMALFIACSKNIVPLVISDPAEHNMKIIPTNPAASDEIKLVIYDDCQYNKFTSLTRNGSTIQIVKQFNSRLMIPCFITSDTIFIGKLPQGSYIINYKLLDNATTPPKAWLDLNFSLMVAQ